MLDSIEPQHHQGVSSMNARWLLSAVFALLMALPIRAEDPKPTAPPEPEGMKQLFTKDLVGWEGDTRLWSFKEGIVKGQTTTENPTKGNTFLIWKGGVL